MILVTAKMINYRGAHHYIEYNAVRIEEKKKNFLKF